MCKLKSGIILKNRVFVPEYDSHTKMLEELGIKDDYLNASKTFVRVELSPADDDAFSDIDTWVFEVDQDIVPDWYSEEDYKPQVIEAVKEWAKTHIHTGVDGLKIETGQNHYIKDCKNVDIGDNATVENICGNATVEKAAGFSIIATSQAVVWENISDLVLCENATLKDRFSKTLYQAGNWETVNVKDGGKIE